MLPLDPGRIVTKFARLKALFTRWNARRGKKADTPGRVLDTHHKDGAVSLIMVVYNLNEKTAEITQRCIESVKRFTTDYELIIIDNASSFGTDSLRQEADVYVRNQRNLGYAPAPLIDELKKDSLIAVIRPGERRERGQGVVIDYKNYHGFCWVIPRKIYAEFKDGEGGLLSEDFKFGYFEDLHLWWRVLSRGYKMAKHFEIRVSHKGGYTIHQMPNLSEITRENERTFVAKTGLANWREYFYG